MNKIRLIGTAALILTSLLLFNSCDEVQLTPEQLNPSIAPSYVLPNETGELELPLRHEGRKPDGIGTVVLEGDIGTFEFVASEIVTVRPDIFQPGHFSLFDVLVHLDKTGGIDLEYHFDETMKTHVIDTINGANNWWYRAQYSGGWREQNNYRMDLYPYKNGTVFRLFQIQEYQLENIYAGFRKEVARLESNGFQVIIPEVNIVGRRLTDNRTFENVAVTAHNVRSDMLQSGVITALDILLSLVEQGELDQLILTWYESIANADPVDSYWTEGIDGDRAYGTCGFVYETGERDGFWNHIHIPSDVRVIVSPEYALWFWICL